MNNINVCSDASKQIAYTSKTKTETSEPLQTHIITSIQTSPALKIQKRALKHFSDNDLFLRTPKSRKISPNQDKNILNSTMEMKIKKKQETDPLSTNTKKTTPTDTAVKNKMQRLIPMKEESSHSPKLFLDYDNNPTSRSLLEYLEYYISSEEKTMLSNIAIDPSYGEKFAYLKDKGPYSDAYINTNTYKTIYWALKNNKLTEWQFIENYHCLSTSLMFRPDSNLYPDVSSQVKSFEIIHYSEINENNRYDNLDKVTYKITFYTDQIGHTQLHGMLHPERHNSKFRSILGWYGLRPMRYQRRALVVTPCNDTTTGLTAHLQLHSFTKCCSLTNALCKQEDCIDIRPTFSSGDIDGLLELRGKNAHPLALWFPNINSLEKPDNIWAGTQAYIHDWAHCEVLNKLGFKKRSFLLGCYQHILEPLLSYTNPNKNPQTKPSDSYFLDKLNIFIEELPTKTTETFNTNIYDVKAFLCNDKSFHEKLMLYKKILVDQSEHDPIHYATKIYNALHQSSKDDTKAFFLLNYILHQAFENKTNNKVYELLANIIPEDASFYYFDPNATKLNNALTVNILYLSYNFWNDIYNNKQGACPDNIIDVL